MIVQLGARQPAAATPSNQMEHVAQSRRVHAYSPAVQRLFDLALAYVEDAEAAARAGTPAAWTMGVFEAPLLYACGTTPVSAIDLGRLGSRDSTSVAEKAWDLPKETCAMISVLLGEWLLRADGPVKRVVAFNNGCEPFNMAYELVQERGYEVYRVEGAVRPKVDVDHDARLEAMVRFLEGELADLARWLTGAPVDEARMAAEIARTNRILAKVQAIMRLRLGNPLYVKSLPTMFLLMGTGHYYGKPDAYEAVLDALVAELQGAPVMASPHGRIVPLTWLGARGIEFGVYQAVDDSGGALLGWHTPNPYYRSWREDVPPLESMARYILDYFLTGSPVHQLRGIEQLVEGTGSRGILFYTYIGCAFGGVHVEMFRDYFKKRGVPGVALDGSFQVGAPSGQILTRIRAFVEMIGGQHQARGEGPRPVTAL